MARTFVDQPTQVFHSDLYDDTLVAGPSLQVSASNLEDDLNAIRSQIRQILWAGVSGSWYDAITAPSGSNSARGLNTINTDLSDLEQKRFLFRRQNLNIVNIATGSVFAQLSSSLGTAPASFAAVGISFATGSVVASLASGTYGSANIDQVSGSSVLTPRNLVIVRDAYNGSHLTGGNGRDIYGLLQAEFGVASGDTFNDVSKRTQITFVKEVVTNSTSSLVFATPFEVGGRAIQYSYVSRVALDDIPEDAYLSNTIFLDPLESVSGSFAKFSDITLQNAISNQVGTVLMTNNIAIQIAAGFSWAYSSGSQNLWNLVSSNSGNSLNVNVNLLGFYTTSPATFQQGISVATGSTEIDVGVTPGYINTLTGSNLTLKAGQTLGLSDFYGGTSTYLGGVIPFATSSLEWNNFASDYGNQTSILGALHFLSQSLSSSITRNRFNAGVKINVSPDVNITFPTNLDAQLGNYFGRNFISDIEIYLNGILCLPGTSLSPNDVYPGTSPATGDLKFPMKLRSGSQLAMVIY